jgi:hypothetical protein
MANMLEWQKVFELVARKQFFPQQIMQWIDLFEAVQFNDPNKRSLAGQLSASL